MNLLPLNEAAGIPFERPSDDRVNRFARILPDHGITVSVRKSRGRDIRAACGQLITESTRKAPGAQLAMLMESSSAWRRDSVGFKEPACTSTSRAISPLSNRPPIRRSIPRPTPVAFPSSSSPTRWSETPAILTFK